MLVRLPIAITALAATFAAGVVGSHFIRDARADSSSQGASVYVPPDGLTFRTTEGRVVAKLSYDSHGGTFELFDERERPTTRMRADSFAPAPPPPAPAPPADTSHPRNRGSDLGF
jgi:hypothetical protein